MSTYQTIAAAYPWGDLLPLPAGVKTPPPAGFTGSTGRPVTEAERAAWAQHQGNYALRLPDGVVGLDVDQYDGKHGLETVRALEAQLGPLPATWTSTGRPFGTGSGIRFYRYPGGKLAGSAGPSVEVIQHEHRYAAVWPSVAGERVYRWHTPAGEPADRVPALGELAELPVSWVEYLRAGASASLAAAGADESRARSVELLTDTNAPCGPMSTAVAEGVERLRAAALSGASRHDVAASAVLHVAMLGSEGHSGAGAGLDVLRAEFDTATVSDPARVGEFDRLVTGAAAKAAMAHPHRPSSDPCNWFGLKPTLAPTPAAGEAVAVQAAPHGRRVELKAASSFSIRPVRWVWEGRIASGTLALVAGREGTGKSTLCYWLAARITRGDLPGQFWGTPAAVLVCATEDSWEHTIVPRLMAADADLERVFMVEAVNDGVHLGLSLPHDTAGVLRAAKDTGAGLLLLDPLMSRLESGLDSHKDAEVRQALEPVVRLADEADLAVVGLMHHNKSGSSDPLSLVMGSKAFTAVARSVHTVIPDPNDETERRRLFATVKNNLGRSDLSMLAYSISNAVVRAGEVSVNTGQLVWAGEVAGSFSELMAPDDDRTATADAKQWLVEYLTTYGGTAPSGQVMDAAKIAGHAMTTLKRARKAARVLSQTVPGSFPRITNWSLPATVGPQLDHPAHGESSGGLTTTTEADKGLWGPVGPVGPEVPHGDALGPTGGPTVSAAPGPFTGTKPIPAPLPPRTDTTPPPTAAPTPPAQTSMTPQQAALLARILNGPKD